MRGVQHPISSYENSIIAVNDTLEMEKRRKIMFRKILFIYTKK